MSAEQDRPAAEIEELRSIIPVHGRRPALGCESLLAWESEHGVVLPEPYRSVIAEIANGSVAGPPSDGGLLALGELPTSWSTWESDNWFSDQPFDGSAPRTPSTPFPLAEEWQWEYDCAPFEERRDLITAVYLQGSVLLGSEEPAGSGRSSPQESSAARSGCSATDARRPTRDLGVTHSSPDSASWRGFASGKKVRAGGANRPSRATRSAVRAQLIWRMIEL